MNKLNNNLFKVMTAVLVVGMAAVGVGMATAQGPGSGQGKGHGFGGERMVAHLNLSEGQMETIKSLHEKSRQDGVELRKELARLKNDMEGEMLKDDPSQKSVLALNEKMGSLKTELKAIRLKTRLAVREQLTPEQRDQMLTMDGKKHRGKGRGEGGREGRQGKGRFGRGQGTGEGACRHGNTECPQKNQ